MSNTTGTGADIGFAKTALDLTTSLLNASNSSNPLINATIEVGQWLGREKLNRHELSDCLSKAKGVAKPNEEGQLFCDRVKKDGLQTPLKHLFLVQSGSLGRLMVGDPWLCWIVSTTAVLFRFHSNADFISDTICTLIMQHRSSTIGSNEDFKLRYRPDRVQTHFVVSRIVSSVWLNVVNAGHATIDLPETLRGICPRGHLLPSYNLGKVMVVLLKDCTKIILQSQHFLQNITLWLVLHHDGLLRVVASGKTVYEKQQGSSPKEIELRVALFCPNTGSCVEDDVLRYEVFEELRDKKTSLNTGTYDPTADLSPKPGIRQPLYAIPRLYPSQSRAGKQTIRKQVEATAQMMVGWLLDVVIIPQVDFAVFGFQAVPGEDFEQPKMRISDIVFQVPSILNFRWGDAASKSTVYSAVESDDEADSRMDSDAEMLDFDPGLEKDRSLEEILPYFPILRDLLDEVKPSCFCPLCRSDDSQTENLLQPGCLRRIAYQEVMFLVAHAVADSLGCKDASMPQDTDPILGAVVVLLLELCEGKKVVWDTWFSVAACVCLGCPFHHHIMDIESSGTTYAAIQHGNLSVIARWFDINTTLKTHRCFGLLQGTGTVGVAHRHAMDSDVFQLRAVEDDFAIIQTEHTEDTTSYVERFRKDSVPIGSTLGIIKETRDMTSDVFIVPASANAYRFILRVRSGDHSRVIDPSDAILRLARGLNTYSCSHKKTSTHWQGRAIKRSFVYKVDEILGRWSNIEGFYGINKSGPPMMNLNVDRTLTRHEEAAASDEAYDGEHVEVAEECIHFSSILTSHLQLNVALALAVNDATVLNDGSSCLSCVQEQVLSIPLPMSQSFGSSSDTVTRTVINTSPSLLRDRGEVTLKRKAIT